MRSRFLLLGILALVLLNVLWLMSQNRNDPFELVESEYSGFGVEKLRWDIIRQDDASGLLTWSLRVVNDSPYPFWGENGVGIEMSALSRDGTLVGRDTSSHAVLPPGRLTYSGQFAVLQDVATFQVRFIDG